MYKKLKKMSFILVCIIVLSGAYIIHALSNNTASNSNKSIVSDNNQTNYNRLGSNGSYDSSYDIAFSSLDEALIESDDILDFTVLEWLKEDSKGMPKTFFKVKINKSFKNTANIGDEVVIRQNGNSKETREGFPLFAIGDRILAYVNYSNEDNYYWLRCDDLYINDVITYEDQLYTLKRSKLDNFPEFRKIELDDETSDDILIYANKRDKLLTEAYQLIGIPNVYTRVTKYIDYVKEIENRWEVLSNEEK